MRSYKFRQIGFAGVATPGVCLMTTALWLWAAEETSANAELLARIVHSWEAMSAATSRASIKWSGVWLTHESVQVSERAEQLHPSGRPLSVEFTEQLAFEGYDGTRVWFFSNRPTRNGETAQLLPVVEQHSILGSEERRVKALHDGGFTEGAIGPVAKSTLLKRADLLPLLLTFRPSIPVMGGIALQELSVLRDREIIDEDECVVVARSRGAAAASERLWLATNRNFIVRRYQDLIYGDDNPAVQIDIQYVLSNGIWIPSQWTFVGRHSRGHLLQLTHCTVQDVLLNAPIQQLESELQVPPGTVIHDKTAPDRRWLLASSDGSLVQISQEVATRAYVDGLREAFPTGTKRLADTLPPVRSHPNAMTPIALLVFVLFVVVATLLFVARCRVARSR